MKLRDAALVLASVACAMSGVAGCASLLGDFDAGGAADDAGDGSCADVAEAGEIAQPDADASRFPDADASPDASHETGGPDAPDACDPGSTSPCDGGAVFEATAIPGCALWLRASRGVTASAGAVSVWADQSGKGRSFAQSVTGKQPTLVPDAIHGQSALRFAQVSTQYLTGPSLSPLQGSEAFLVFQDTGAEAEGLWRVGATTDFSTVYMGLVEDCYGSASPRYVNTTYKLTQTSHLYDVVSIPNEWSSFIDGAQLNFSSTNTVGFDTAGTLLGATGRAFAAPAYYWNGLIAEMVVYDHKLSAADRASVVAGLRALYATP
jgi:hypothetical protein